MVARTQAVATVVAGQLLTGVGDLDICLPDIFTQPWRGPSMFRQQTLVVALDAPQLFYLLMFIFLPWLRLTTLSSLTRSQTIGKSNLASLLKENITFQKACWL